MNSLMPEQITAIILDFLFLFTEDSAQKNAMHQLQWKELHLFSSLKWLKQVFLNFFSTSSLIETYLNSTKWVISRLSQWPLNHKAQTCLSGVLDPYFFMSMIFTYYWKQKWLGITIIFWWLPLEFFLFCSWVLPCCMFNAFFSNFDHHLCHPFSSSSSPDHSLQIHHFFSSPDCSLSTAHFL